MGITERATHEGEVQLHPLLSPDKLRIKSTIELHYDGQQQMPGTASRPSSAAVGEEPSSIMQSRLPSSGAPEPVAPNGSSRRRPGHYEEMLLVMDAGAFRPVVAAAFDVEEGKLWAVRSQTKLASSSYVYAFAVVTLPARAGAEDIIASMQHSRTYLYVSVRLAVT